MISKSPYTPQSRNNKLHLGGGMQDCNVCSALLMEILQSTTKCSILYELIKAGWCMFALFTKQSLVQIIICCLDGYKQLSQTSGGILLTGSKALATDVLHFANSSQRISTLMVLKPEYCATIRPLPLLLMPWLVIVKFHQNDGMTLLNEHCLPWGPVGFFSCHHNREILHTCEMNMFS